MSKIKEEVKTLAQDKNEFVMLFRKVFEILCNLLLDIGSLVTK